MRLKIGGSSLAGRAGLIGAAVIVGVALCAFLLSYFNDDLTGLWISFSISNGPRDIAEGSVAPELPRGLGPELGDTRESVRSRRAELPVKPVRHIASSSTQNVKPKSEAPIRSEPAPDSTPPKKQKNPEAHYALPYKAEFWSVIPVRVISQLLIGKARATPSNPYANTPTDYALESFFKDFSGPVGDPSQANAAMVPSMQRTALTSQAGLNDNQIGLAQAEKLRLAAQVNRGELNQEDASQQLQEFVANNLGTNGSENQKTGFIGGGPNGMGCPPGFVPVPPGAMGPRPGFPPGGGGVMMPGPGTGFGPGAIPPGCMPIGMGPGGPGGPGMRPPFPPGSPGGPGGGVPLGVGMAALSGAIANMAAAVAVPRAEAKAAAADIMGDAISEMMEDKQDARNGAIWRNGQMAIDAMGGEAAMNGILQGEIRQAMVSQFAAKGDAQQTALKENALLNDEATQTRLLADQAKMSNYALLQRERADQLGMMSSNGPAVNYVTRFPGSAPVPPGAVAVLSASARRPPQNNSGNIANSFIQPNTLVGGSSRYNRQVALAGTVATRGARSARSLGPMHQYNSEFSTRHGGGDFNSEMFNGHFQ
jgi:hypothetical protein